MNIIQNFNFRTLERYKVLIFILALGSFLRFNNLANIAYFEFDDQYNSYLVYNLVKNHKFSLVGQETSFGGMFLGPWHYLYLVPFYIATNLHPIGGFIGEGFLGLITIAGYYFVGTKLFSKKVGIFASFLRAIGVYFIRQDLNIGPAFPSELVALLFFYFLVRFYQKDRFSIIVLSFLSGMMFTVHLVILPLIIVWGLIFAIYRPIKLSVSIILRSILAFLIPISPILVFEIKHKFSHIIRFLDTLFQNNESSYDFWQRIAYIFSYNIGAFVRVFSPKYLPWWLGIIVFILILITMFLSKTNYSKSYQKIIFCLTYLTVFLYYLVYPRNVPGYYFMALLPLTILYTSGLLEWLWSKKLAKLFVVAFFLVTVISNTQSLYEQYNNPNKFNLAQKDKAVRTIVEHQRGKREFSISYFTEYGRHYGFQYFFTLYGLEPRHQITPPIYSIVIPRAQVAQEDLSVWFNDIGIIFPEKEPEQWQ